MIQKEIWDCYRIFCVAEDFAPPGPGGLGLDFFFDTNEVEIKQMLPTRLQALQR